MTLPTRSLRAPIAVVSSLLLAAGLTGCGKKASGKWDMPVDAKQLPGTTTEIAAEIIDGTRETDPHIKQAYTSSELGSEICKPGTLDPARQLEILTLLGPSSAKQFFAQKNIDTVQSLMECGDLLTTNLANNFQTAIEFTDDSNAKQEVGILNLTATDIPAKYGFSKHAFSGIDGFCKTADPSKPGASSDCGTSTEAALHQGTAWWLGKRSALDTVAHNVASPKTDLSTTVAAINDAAVETEGLPSARIQGQVQSSKNFLQAPCAWGAFQTAGSLSDFMSACFPSTDDKIIQDIDAKVRAAAFEIEPDVVKAGAVHGNIVFVARDGDGAKEIEKDANDFVTDWKSQIQNNEAKHIKQAKSDPISLRQKNWAIIVDNWAHALEKMKVSRSGRTVKLAFNESVADDDKRDLDDANKKTLDTRAAVADVLDAISAKKSIPVDALSKLVGQPWAQYLATLSSPAASGTGTPTQSSNVELTSVECKISKKSAARIKPKDMPTPQAAALLNLLRNADCNRPPLVAASTRSCLQTGFKNAAELAKCAPGSAGGTTSTPGTEPPESQFGVKNK